jgi:nitrite reductase/ring-hydroxylating ferredoxin subunit
MTPVKWLPLAKAEDVPEGKGLLVRNGRQEILIFHSGDRWTAFDNTCPHAGAPITPDHIDDGCVICVYHGLRFRTDTGACPDAAGWCLESFPVKVEAGQVLVGFKDLG